MNTQSIVPEQPHHLVVRGNNKRRVFSYPRDYRAYFELLSRALRATGCELHAACLMSNHIHLLVTPPDRQAIPRLLENVNQPYGLLRNAQRNATGKLFDRRYYCQAIENIAEQGIVTCFIERNPQHAGIAEDGEDYRWSTHRLSSGSDEPSEWWSERWRPTPWYESLASTPKARADEYRRVYQRYLEQGIEPEPPEGGWPLGA
jgi:putative transposase